MRHIASLAIASIAFASVVSLAAAQPSAGRVQTRDGLVLTLPSAYRAAPELQQLPGLSRPPELAFAVDGERSRIAPLQVFVFRDPELVSHSLTGLARGDARSNATGAAFADKIRASLGLEAADVKSSGFDAERGAFRSRFVIAEVRRRMTCWRPRRTQT
jgi:hypothetical protein